MKKTLISIALASAASAVFAGTHVENFSWANQPLTTANVQVATVNPFNTGLGVLTSVAINLNGTSVIGSASVLNQGTQTSTFTLSLFGNHTVTINGTALVNNIGTSSAGVALAPGATGSLGPVSAALSGSANGGLAGWSPAGIPVFIRFNGAFGVSAAPEVQFQATPNLRSTGVGTVTYTYDTPIIPEAETYVAGLALAGLAGYGFYRRNRKA